MPSDPSDDDIKLFTTKQVAEACEVRAETVRNWINSGALPALRLDNQWRIRKTDLRSFLEKRYHLGDNS